ncbi:hypothetical protein RRG08_024611 [Elysia crispata]|uniref:Uncharacterized protein n=1 Tax=Elysia crispata TaxID=231223 RepID=A0AAE1DNW8_9GAST|nr:hypothetical protein RRG08_024611 [Elysia crispata]
MASGGKACTWSRLRVSDSSPLQNDVAGGIKSYSRGDKKQPPVSRRSAIALQHRGQERHVLVSSTGIPDLESRKRPQHKKKTYDKPDRTLVSSDPASCRAQVNFGFLPLTKYGATCETCGM